MDIYKTINKWFEETLNNFIKDVSPEYPVNRFLLSSLLALRKYSLASIILIEKDHKMPTKALLRTMIEFLTKITWCLAIHEKHIKNKAETVEMRHKRWWKATVLRRINELKNWINVSDIQLRKQVQSELHQLMEMKTQYEDIEPMPLKFFRLLDELPEDYKNDIYPRFYLKYNDAIHLDDATLGLLVRKQDDHVTYYEDSQDSSDELLKQVIYCAFMINDWTRTHYSWDTEQLRQEHESLLKQLPGKET